MKKITPRKIGLGIAILYAVFISLFAFDTGSFLGTLIHLIPTLLYVGVIVLSFKKREIGGPLIILLGLISIFFFNTYRELLNFVTISLIPIIAGILIMLKD